MAVWIGNLKESVTDEDLKRFFSRCTEKGAIAIASCKVMRDENGQSRKFGYVNFHSDADAEAAAEAMDGVKIHSVPIKTKGPGTLRSSGHSTNVSLTDCLYYSQSGNCKKGNQCPYRHSDKARVSTQVCRQWMEKKCSNQRCPYKHPAGEGKEAPVERVTLPAEVAKQSYFPCGGQCGIRTCEALFPTDSGLAQHIGTLPAACGGGRRPSGDTPVKAQKMKLRTQKSWIGDNMSGGMYGENNSQSSDDCESVYGAAYGDGSMTIDSEEDGEEEDEDEDEYYEDEEEGEEEKEEEKQDQPTFTRSKRPAFCRLESLNDDDSTCYAEDPVPVRKDQSQTSRSNVPVTSHQLEPVGVFWDIENCAVPPDKSAFALANKMRKMFFEGKREAEFLCVCDIGKERKEIMDDLNRAQVTLVHISAVAKNAADDKLRQSLRRFAHTYHPPCTVVLISGDVNFAPELKDLRHTHNITITLVHNRQASDALKVFANNLVLFDDLIKDLEPPSVQPSVATKVVVLGLPVMRGKADQQKISARLGQLCDNCGGKVLGVNAETRKANILFRSSEMAMKAQKRMTGEDVYGSKIQVVLQGGGQQVPDKTLQRRASLQKQGCLEVQPTAPVPRPFQGSVLPTGGGQRLPLQNKCDQFVVKLFIKVQADSNLRGNADVLRKWLNSVFHEAHVKADHLAFLWHSYSEFHVLLKLDILQSAINQKDVVASFYQAGSLSLDMAKQFGVVCCKAIQSICQKKRLPWLAEVCSWDEEEESGNRTIRSNVIEVLLKQHFGYLSWSQFKAKYSEQFGSSISELMIQTCCKDAVHFLVYGTCGSQVICLYELSPLLRMAPDQMQSFRNNLTALLNSLPHKKIKVMNIVGKYTQKYGPIPMSRGTGTLPLLHVIRTTPKVEIRGKTLLSTVAVLKVAW